MPYTPPAQRSPAGSRPESPPRSRDGAKVKPLPSSSPFLSGPRPNLPRSASSTSYLHKHRRSPSSPNPSAPYSTDFTHNPQHVVSHDWAKAPNASLRQSPPPINNHSIPTGTIISPPDSGNNSSDEEGLTMAQSANGKKLSNFADLQAAISSIKQRESLPGWAEEEKQKTLAALGLDSTVPDSGVHLQLPSSPRPPLSKEARKISHSRSATETAIDLPRSQSYSPPEGSSDSDDIDDEGLEKKPKMLRKKSGELVRPALRPASARRRPTSMPGTPTFSKAVHFSSDLEHVRHFLQVDKPLAVSAETSPVETMDDESAYPFPQEPQSKPQFEWEIKPANFLPSNLEHGTKPVHVERVFLSSNKKTLIGTVAVQNLAFHKMVIARFTFDYWKTTSEVTAEFSQDVRRQYVNDGLDRFNFNLQLSDQTNLESKTLFFCVRYVVNGQEFWDSNNDVNYQVEFVKKQVAGAKVQNEATQHLNGLPRSRSPGQSPQSKKNFDDFGLAGFDSYWSPNKDSLPRAQSANSLLDGEKSAPLKFRSKATGNALEDLPDRKQAKGAAQALGNRYDFNKSLSAALTAASNALGERSGLPAPVFDSKATSPKSKPAFTSSGPLAPAASAAPALIKQATETPPSPSPQNLSYEELVEKYCFFGNGGKVSQPKLSRSVDLTRTQTDGAGSLGPSAAGKAAPVATHTETVQAAVDAVAERLSRSASPARSEVDSRASSPSSFGYPYHQSLNSSFAPATAIHG